SSLLVSNLKLLRLYHPLLVPYALQTTSILWRTKFSPGVQQANGPLPKGDLTNSLLSQSQQEGPYHNQAHRMVVKR
ncbi:hypothetical protein LINPERPRIM_LOCUS9766, partial [Linum perenne]